MTATNMSSIFFCFRWILELCGIEKMKIHLSLCIYTLQSTLEVPEDSGEQVV